MRVRNSKPVADCLTPVGWQVGMGKERGSNKVMGQHHRYNVLERQMQLQSRCLPNTHDKVGGEQFDETTFFF